jgi:hypothetical protein
MMTRKLPLLLMRTSCIAELVLELANTRPLRSVTANLLPTGAFSITIELLVDQTLTLLLNLKDVLMTYVESFKESFFRVSFFKVSFFKVSFLAAAPEILTS